MALADSIGFLGSLLGTSGKVRKYIHEPAYSTRFTDANLSDYLRRAIVETMGELDRYNIFRPRARVSITVVAEQEFYALPPIGKFLLFEKVNTTTLRPEWEVVPNHPLSPFDARFTIEGPVLRLSPVWAVGETMRITYVPAFDGEVVEFTCQSSPAATSSTVTATTMIAGTLDVRPHAYVGWTLQSLNMTVAEVRLVTAYNATTGLLTVSPNFGTTPTGGTSKFELVPLHQYRFQDLLAFRIARQIAAVIGDATKMKTLQTEYQESLRALRLDLSQADGRKGNVLPRHTRGRYLLGKRY